MTWTKYWTVYWTKWTVVRQWATYVPPSFQLAYQQTRVVKVRGYLLHTGRHMARGPMSFGSCRVYVVANYWQTVKYVTSSIQRTVGNHSMGSNQEFLRNYHKVCWGLALPTSSLDNYCPLIVLCGKKYLPKASLIELFSHPCQCMTNHHIYMIPTYLA
jgi:hypothetical protein